MVRIWEWQGLRKTKLGKMLAEQEKLLLSEKKDLCRARALKF